MTSLWMVARRIATSQRHWLINAYNPRCFPKPSLHFQAMHTNIGRIAMHQCITHTRKTLTIGELALHCYSTRAIPTGYTPLVLYKARWIKPLRLLVRAKVFQLVAVAAVAFPMTTMFTEGTVTNLDVLIAVALVGGCAVAGTVRLLWAWDALTNSNNDHE